MSQSRSRQLTQLLARLERQERETVRLRNTLKGVANEVGGLTVNGRCDRCQQAYLLVADGRIYCPKCKNGQTL